MSAAPALATEAVPVSPSAIESPRFVRRLLKKRVAVASLILLVIVVLVACFAPVLLPSVSTQFAGDLTAVRQGPSWAHPLGTDTLGRDVLDRLLVGTRVTMVGVVEALIVGLLLGVPFGLAAGYFGGRIDRVVTWLADLTFSMPAIIIILVVLAVFPQNMNVAMFTLGVLAAPSLMRVVRSATLPVKEELYIAAARVSGLSRSYIVTRQVLPRIAGPVIVQASLLAATALLVQTGLAFLGVVVAPPAPSWGGMVADGMTVLTLQAWLIWPPGLAIAFTILALGLLGDSVRDATAEGWAGSVSAPARQSRIARSALPAPAAEIDDTLPLLSVQGVSVAFVSPGGDTIQVVEEVSFEIAAGETVGLVGESGCGKTATAMAILNLLPGSGHIEAGRILFEGQELTALAERELRSVRGKEIGLVSQEPMISLNPAFRVGTQLAEAVSQHQGLSRRAARRRAIELLEQVQLPDPEAVARRYPHELSGGMAQRVAIARALAGEPKLLIADEPTTALDVTVQADILDLLRELQTEREMAILLVTHDWGVVADICDRAIVMYAGQVVEQADVAPLFRDSLHPYTRALLASNPQHAAAADALPTIPGIVPRPGQWPSGCHFHPRCAHATDACRISAIPLERAADRHDTRCIHHAELATAR